MKTVSLDIRASSMIVGMRHDEDETLFVKFKNGAVWKYSPITLDKATELFVDIPLTDSVGKNFHANVRGKLNDTECKESPFPEEEDAE